jgi:hypothetical protein
MEVVSRNAVAPLARSDDWLGSARLARRLSWLSIVPALFLGAARRSVITRSAAAGHVCQSAGMRGSGM